MSKDTKKIVTIVLVILLLATISYSAWFSMKNGRNWWTSNPTAATGRRSENESKSNLIDGIIYRFPNQSEEHKRALKTQLDRLSYDQLNMINSVVVAARRVGSVSASRINCSPMENAWNNAIDGAGIGWAGWHICGGIWY